MASQLITQFNDFSVKSFSYGTPVTNARGGKSIKIRDVKNNTLVLSAPLILTWGINKMVDEETGKVSYNMSLQMPDGDYGTASSRKFHTIMKDFENRILDDAVKYSKDWFGKPKMSREVAEALFTPVLKYPKDKKSGEPDYTRAPTMRVKVPYWEGKFNIELYDTNTTPIFTPNMEIDVPFETLIPKASHVATIIQCNGLWFAAGKFGVTFQVIQAVVRRPARIQGGCFITLSSDDHQLAEDAARKEAEELASAEVVEEFDTHVQDTDDEQQQDTTTTTATVEDTTVVETEEEAPKPKPKRRVVKKAA
jgi:hypothetical protein